ncbi:MAG: hypothetical protein AB1585_20115 [Thermodesulfobacteriota bacterium]
MTIDYSRVFNRAALKEILIRYRKKIQKEVDSVKDLTSLIMRGSRGRWTKEELRLIKEHFVLLGKKMPIFMVFMLPGGSILLPLLVEVLDRRRRNRPVTVERRKAGGEGREKKKG